MRRALLFLGVVVVLGSGFLFALPRLPCLWRTESFTVTVRDSRGQPASGGFYNVLRKRVSRNDGFLGGPPATWDETLQTGIVPSDGVVHLPPVNSTVWWVVNEKVPFEGRVSWPCGRGEREITLSDANDYTLSVLVDGAPPERERRVSLQLAEKARPSMLPRKLGPWDVFEARDFWFYGRSTDDTGCVQFHGLDFVEDLEEIDLAWEGGYELAPGTSSPFPMQRGDGFGELSLVSPLSVRGRVVDAKGVPVPAASLIVEVEIDGRRETSVPLELSDEGAFEVPIRHRSLTLARHEGGQRQVDEAFGELVLRATDQAGRRMARVVVPRLDHELGAEVGDLVLVEP